MRQPGQSDTAPSHAQTGWAPSSKTQIVLARDPGDVAAALAIREIVFIEEQAVPHDIERDDQDEIAIHVLALRGGHAVGTGRLVVPQRPPEGASGKWGRISRMAVLAAHRKAGVGRLILRALEHEAQVQGLHGLVLHAQVLSKGFYENEGYEPSEAIFEEAGMPHMQMSKRLAAG
jgi:predicted GNAT family N-acyltransferase